MGALGTGVPHARAPSTHRRPCWSPSTLRVLHLPIVHMQVAEEPVEDGDPKMCRDAANSAFTFGALSGWRSLSSTRRRQRWMKWSHRLSLA